MLGYISPFDYGKYVPGQGFVVDNRKKLVFNATDLEYSSSESNLRDFNISFSLSETFFTKNITMNLHIEITANMDEFERFDPENPVFTTHRSIPLIKFTPKVEKKKLVNLLGDTIDEGTVKEELKNMNEDYGILDENKKKDEKYVHHLKPDIYCYFAPDFTVFTQNSIPEQIKMLYRVNHMYNYYEPIVEWSDFWIYYDLLVPLNDTIQKANVTVHIQPYSLMKLSMLHSFEMTNNMYKQWGMSSDLDMTKKMLAETNFYLLILTLFVTLAHTVCEFMAFKNEIHFWKNRDSLKGISVRTLFINFSMAFIIFLYLLDREDETSLMIKLPAGIAILIEGWKITKATKVSSKSTFPFISIEDKDSYNENDTAKYDKVAITYLSYVMFPLLACYAVYSFIYEQHRGYYSYIINSLVGAVYVFGFITMTPQLYINYKLKSVEHLPWRALVYRFLNTIIDDLFSFIISMPTMHRISWFRDDIIFLIYIYQRWIYKVDKKRDPYGSLDKDSKAEEDKVASSVKEKEDPPIHENNTDCKDDDTVVTKKESGATKRKQNNE